jgi:hypothetical protein
LRETQKSSRGRGVSVGVNVGDATIVGVVVQVAV